MGDFTDITAAVDFSGVLTGLGVVAVALAGVYIARKGAKILLGFLGR